MSISSPHQSSNEAKAHKAKAAYSNSKHHIIGLADEASRLQQLLQVKS